MSVLVCRTPHLVAADAAFYSAKNDAEAKAMGVKRVSVPNRSTKSPARNASRRNGGSAMGKNGAPDAKDASASQNDATASIGAATKATVE
jgi:hypothetical protein